MEATLFPGPKLGDFLLDITYKGSSFEGQMELGVLELELAGLNDSLETIIRILYKNKQIEFSPDQIQLYVEAFEKGSFRKRIQLVIKGIEKHPTTSIVVATLFVGILNAIPLYKADKIKEMSPALVAKISDRLKVELLQDPKFLRSIAQVVEPLSNTDDQLVIRRPDNNSVSIDQIQKEEFIKLSGISEDTHVEKEAFETLKGKVTRVDLDAIKNHIGFKIEDKGTTIQSTLLEKVSQEEMKYLLGQWIEITGTTTSMGAERTHIDIAKYKIVERPQQEMIIFE